MKASLDRVQRLWLEGYSLAQIAKRLRMSPSTIYNHLSRGTLSLPDRPWGTAENAGVSHSTAYRWASIGLVRRAPCGLYHVEDLQRLRDERRARMCAHPGCDTLLGKTSTRHRFCDAHRRSGVDPERVIQILNRRPGLNRSDLYQALGVTSSVMRPILDSMEAEGRIIRLPGPRSSILHYAA